MKVMKIIFAIALVFLPMAFLAIQIVLLVNNEIDAYKAIGSMFGWTCMTLLCFWMGVKGLGELL